MTTALPANALEFFLTEGGILTGSRAYGEPRENSDTDVILLVTKDRLLELSEAADEMDSGDEYDDTNSVSLRFGGLNLLCFTDADEFGAWKSATEELVARKPVTRQQAIETIDAKLCLAFAAIEFAEEQALQANAEWMANTEISS